MDMPLLANVLGFLSLSCYLITLLPTILRIVFPKTKQTGIPQWLLKQRRKIGILAFFFAILHGYLLVIKRNFDFLDIQTYWIYIQGVTTFIIFTILAVTSNDWSMKKMKKNWKKLHQLTYIAMFLLAWHIWDKMWGHWTYITPVGIIATVGIIGLFILRMWIENQKSKKKAPQDNLSLNLSK